MLDLLQKLCFNIVTCQGTDGFRVLYTGESATAQSNRIALEERPNSKAAYLGRKQYPLFGRSSV